MGRAKIFISSNERDSKRIQGETTPLSTVFSKKQSLVSSRRIFDDIQGCRQN